MERELELPVVIDCGSGKMKVGFGGEESPRAVIPSIVGRYKCLGILPQKWELRAFFVGDEAIAKRGKLKLKYPIEHGMVTNWNDMEGMWKFLYRGRNCDQYYGGGNHLGYYRRFSGGFFDGLGVYPEDHPVLLNEAPLNPRNNREKMTSIMFETLDVPKLYIAINEVLSLYTYGRTSGVAVGIGDGVTHTVPVYEGCAIHHSILRMNLAGRDITDYLVKILGQSGYEMTTSAEWEIVEKIKEEYGFVRSDVNSYEDLNSIDDNEVEYELPEGSKIKINSERYRAPEIMFRPLMIGSQLPGIHETIFNSIQKCDVDLRKNLYSNICLCGGSSLFPGLDERIEDEVRRLAPFNARVRVSASEEREHAAWIGGSIISSLSTMDNMWITKDEYEDAGACIVHRKCFTGGGVGGFANVRNDEPPKDMDLMDRIVYCCGNVNLFTLKLQSFTCELAVSKCFLML